jgi:hypothetical protein
MNRLIQLLAVVGAVLLASCHTGPQVAEMDVLRQPQGAAVVADVNQEGERKRLRVAGELIEVRDDGVVLETSVSDGAQLTFIPWRIVYRLQATDLKGFRTISASGGVGRPEAVERMRLVSRFPQGLTDELMATLLASYGQMSLVELSPGG